MTDRTNSSSARRNRVRLGKDIAMYYQLLTLQPTEEENGLAESLARATKEIDFDRET